jgi:hypothetical protein
MIQRAMNDTPRYVGVAARRSGVAGTGTAVTVGRAVGDAFDATPLAPARKRLSFPAGSS